jgi:hypothetical protein
MNFLRPASCPGARSSSASTSAARGGVEVAVHPSVALAVEAPDLRTRFAVPSVDVARVDTLASSRGVDISAVYTF